jgi:hypothetical protein
MKTEWGQAEGKIVISKMLVRDLHSKAELQGIDTQKRVTHRLVTGWEGKGKGLLQILWERGWIDESMVKPEMMDAQELDTVFALMVRRN